MEELIKLDAYPIRGLVRRLLQDKTTRKNILFASDSYANYGVGYQDNSQMTEDALLGFASCDIQPRVYKAAAEQTERTRKRAEVFTPAWIVNQMNNHCDAEWFGRQDVFNRQTGESWETIIEPISFPEGKDWKQYVDSRRLEITCGEAPYIVSRYDTSTGEIIPIEKRVGILDRKIRIVNENVSDEAEWFEWVLRAFQSVYGYEYQGDNLLIARMNLLYTLADYIEEKWHRQATKKELEKFLNVICWNFWQMDGLNDTVPLGVSGEDFHQFSFFDDEEPVDLEADSCKIYNHRSGSSLFFADIKEGKSNMKFDFVIGNPPYQEEAVGDSNTATPIYNLFMNSSYSISNRVLLITPARFLFNAGYTPKDWNQKMLTDPHFKVVYYNPNSAEVFSGVDIKGGVAITYRDKDRDYGSIETFTRYDALNHIFHKITKYEGFESISDIIVTSFAYHFTHLMYDENPSLVGRSSKGHEFDLQSNSFDTFPEIFVECPTDNKDYIRILGRSSNKRCYRYIDRRYVKHVSNLDKYKVFIAKAAGSGLFGEVLPESILGHPKDGGTVTFTSIGNFETEIEAINCTKYICTKFARTLLGVLKVTQDLTPSKWKYVPLQDFTPTSDIDWSKPIPEIDKQLYAKYGLTQKEIDFIETHVKEME